MFSKSTHSNPVGWREFLALILLAAAAYGTVAWNYLPSGDDFIYIGEGPDRFLSLAHGLCDVWRILAYALIGFLLRISPSLAALVAILLHALNACLLLRILRQLHCPRGASLSLAALFVTFPGYHEAVSCVAGTGYVYSTTGFLFCLTLALESLDGVGAIGSFLVFFGLTLISNLFWEQLDIAFFALPFIVSFWEGTVPWKWETWKSRWPLLGASLGAVFYIFLFKFTSTPDSIRHVELNVETLVSPLFYQYANFYAYLPWFHPGMLGQRVFDQIPEIAPICLLPLAAGIALLWFALKKAQPDENRPSTTPFLMRFCGSALALISIYGIYSLGAGYSLDSRKRYDILIGLIFLAVPFLSSMRLKSRAAVWAILALIAWNTVTTVLLTSIHNVEAARFNELMDLAADHGNAGHPSAYTVDPYQGREPLWKYLRPFWQEAYHPDMLSPLLIRYEHAEGGPPPEIYFDLQTDTWIFRQ